MHGDSHLYSHKKIIGRRLVTLLQIKHPVSHHNYKGIKLNGL
ncbi:hypothetical protein J437_LFUL008227 [Ladona fulva]|uniref:Uncharacterized protein n=1 Tax=Ladona fulva TaxID=123851 RepID=A0A8K0P0Q6_LADFU|nr:hypothetical protein J437_LFUL008227 [Ladona fulva]